MSMQLFHEPTMNPTQASESDRPRIDHISAFLSLLMPEWESTDTLFHKTSETWGASRGNNHETASRISSHIVIRRKVSFDGSLRMQHDTAVARSLSNQMSSFVGISSEGLRPHPLWQCHASNFGRRCKASSHDQHRQ